MVNNIYAKVDTYVLHLKNTHVLPFIYNIYTVYLSYMLYGI